MSEFEKLINQRKLYFQTIKFGNRYPDLFINNLNKTHKVYPSDFYPFLFLNEKISSNPFLTLVTPSSSEV